MENLPPSWLAAELACFPAVFPSRKPGVQGPCLRRQASEMPNLLTACHGLEGTFGMAVAGRRNPALETTFDMPFVMLQKKGAERQCG